MNIINNVVFNLILVMFPCLVYFIYNCYRELKCDKYNGILLNVALVSSLYLLFKYGNFDDVRVGLLFCNLPIIILYLKREMVLASILSLIVVSYSYMYLDVNIGFSIFKYFSYMIIYILGVKKDVKDNTFIVAIVILQGFFLTFEYFVSVSGSNLFTIVEIFMLMIIFYLLPFFLLYLFKLGDNVSGLYLTVSELERDKQVRNSIFKITHEVKNPMAVCKGYLEMFDVNDKEKSSKYLAIIKSELNRGLDIMNDFMEFSKIKIDKEIVDISMLLEDIEEEFELFISNKDINFSCDYLDDEVYIMGDYNRLKQVLINMVKNSIESIEDKGEIEVRGYIDSDKYCVEVIDNGCGMDSETLDRVKEMFFTTKVKGTGLGVSLSNEIIKAHNGSIEYSSRVGEGTKVIVKIPMDVL